MEILIIAGLIYLAVTVKDTVQQSNRRAVQRGSRMVR